MGAVVGFLLLFALERAFPLRPMRAPPLPRLGQNLVFAGLALAVAVCLQAPILEALASSAEGRNYGLLRWIALPPALATVFAFLFLDYTLWVWHWLNHKVPFLWRFHLVHHVDRDLDASTGLRFHFGEMILSIGFRSAQVAALGADLAVVNAWQGILLASVLFHHSNLRLPERFDARLSWLLVTPRMHGIHHSNIHAETDSNWSSLLSVWDRLHGTFLGGIPQERVEIGVPAYAREADVELPRVLASPFREQRDDWVDAQGRRREVRER